MPDEHGHSCLVIIHQLADGLAGMKLLTTDYTYSPFYSSTDMPTPPSLRVLHVLNSTSGGSAASTLQLIEALKGLGVESSLLCFNNGTEAERAQIRETLEGRVLFRPLRWMNKRIRARGLKRPLVEAKDWLSTWGGTRFLKEFEHFAQQHQVQLVHSSTLVNPEGALLAKRLGVPHVFHGRELIGPGQPYRFYRFGAWCRWMVQHSRTIIANSRVTEANYAQFFPKEHLQYIPNAIPLEGFRVKTHGAHTPVVVGMVGNLKSRWKDHPLFVDIALQALAAGLPVEFRMYGQLPQPEDDYVRGMRERIEKAGHADRIRFMGYQTDPTAFMPHLDVMLHTAAFESFGRVFIEALACGVPVIAMAAGGALDIVKPGHNGALFTSPEEAVAALRPLVHDAVLRQQYGEAGRAGVEQEFALPILAQRVHELYQTLLK